MPKALTYADAVKLLDGSSPLVKVADNLLGGALSLATAGGSDVALSFFDAKAEAVRLGQVVASRITDSVRGLGRYDRSRRLQAAHGVLVVTAFFGALDDCLTEAGIDPPGFARDDQVALTAPAVGGDWLGGLLGSDIPVLSPDHPYDLLLRDLEVWFARQTNTMMDHLTGLAVWDQADERARRAVQELSRDHLPDRATARYDDSMRRLAGDVPEFGLWVSQQENRAATRGLEALEAILRQASSHRDPVRHRAALATAYRAGLDRPVLGGDAGDLVMPSLGAAYLDPRFRVKAAGPGARPAEEDWWDTGARDDLAGFLATYLTTPQAADTLMVLLGHPGAGKSSLTKVLAARLPAADFLVVRVALRDVPAEAEIQDQVERALRGAIGETVSWAALAEDAGAAMPVLLLDGFDELLQVTGIHQSDYLQRVAAFQHREKTLGRPVAVIVTSRVAVADRARIPAGALAVRLEPFDEPQLERWLGIWNGTNAAALAALQRRPLSLPVLQRFPDLAAQPLLLLMLALYDATGNSLLDDETLDTGELYERLLGEFAAREVRRMHPGAPDQATAELVEEELLRLSVVAFAMFHRMRLWVTTEELDSDLAGFGLRPLAAVRTENFRAPVTAGQEMVGRFFFIQSAQARQEDKTLQTYEFLHATFGEYLAARLVVQAVGDAAARARARTLRLGPSEDDDLLQSLLGLTPLTARATVLPFITAMLGRSDSVREWLVERLRAAVTRPQYTPRAYQPIDKRIDHWMATYSFNLLLLTLACGEPVRASELFLQAKDPADWLRSTALQWRAAVPSGIWLDSLEELDVVRRWTDDNRRDLVLITSKGHGVSAVGPLWSHHVAPDSEIATWVTGGLSDYFPLRAAVTSMQLSGALSDDAFRHALEPMLDRLPDTVSAFAIHGRADLESVARSLVKLWLASAFRDEPGRLLHAYERAIRAVNVPWQPADGHAFGRDLGITVVLRSLTQDAARLPGDRVLNFLSDLVLARPVSRLLNTEAAVECLLVAFQSAGPATPHVDLVLPFLSHDIDVWPISLVLRVLSENPPGLQGPTLVRIMKRIEEERASPEVVDAVNRDPTLAARLDEARADE